MYIYIYIHILIYTPSLTQAGSMNGAVALAYAEYICTHMYIYIYNVHIYTYGYIPPVPDAPTLLLVLRLDQ